MEISIFRTNDTCAITLTVPEKLETASHADKLGWAIQDAQFDGLKFHNLVLEYANLRCADFEGVMFNSCRMRGCHFNGADLEGASFINCTLNGASFEKAILERLSVHQSDMTGCVFNGATLKSATIKTTNLTGTSFTDADTTDLTIIPPIYDFDAANSLELARQASAAKLAAALQEVPAQKDVTLRALLDHIFEGETERRLATAWCEIRGEDSDGHAQWGDDPSFRRWWQFYTPDVEKLLEQHQIRKENE